MRLLLDTHILLALLDQRTEKLPPSIRRVLADQANEFSLSAASLWEIAIKSRLGKLRVTQNLDLLPGLIREMGIALLPISEHHVLADVQPEPETRDPFDRLQLAQCQIEGLRLVTVDRALAGHGLVVG